MNRTAIEWCDFSANPLKYRSADGRVVWACEKLSPGCKHCYANGLADRYTHRRAGDWNANTMATLTPFLDEQELRRMLTYTPAAGKRCFLGDMTDVCGDWVPAELLDRLFAVLALRGSVTWQVLTKRAARLRTYLTATGRREAILRHALELAGAVDGRPEGGLLQYAFELEELWARDRYWPLPNVWVGVSCEDQARADERIPHLLETPAAIRFVSAEPLLSCVDLTKVPVPDEHAGKYAGHGFTFNSLQREDDLTLFNAPSHLDWVIVGGESGPGSRPCDLAWIRSLVRQGRDSEVPVFVKQVGSRPFDYINPNPHTGYKGDLRVFRNNLDVMELISQHEGRLPNTIANHEIRNQKGGALEEWPEDLRIREFPSSQVPA